MEAIREEVDCPQMEMAHYELVCSFSNMGVVLDNLELGKCQEFVLKTNQLPNVTCTWIIGLEKNATQNRWFDVFCVLSEIKGKTEKDIEATFEFETKRVSNGLRYRCDMKKEFFAVNTRARIPCLYETDKNYILQPDGLLNLYVKLCFPLHLVTLQSAQAKEDGLKDLALQSATTLHRNLDKLYSEMEYSDIIIVTSDEIELSAHRLILQMRNPVFKSMLRSDLSESKTGIIKVDDVCGKTMKTILRYLYTSELSANWKDADIIVEFVYAAGKYQLTEVLKMIDDTLGHDMSDECSSCLIPLLSLVGKLSLKNAETRLLHQIRLYTAKVTTAEEFFVMLGNQDQDAKSPVANKETRDYKQ